ncbi:plasma membrane-associated cation-binding protein 1 isoform X2 [Abrus precatorius]|uniref:Plasma membrane-associated cation-binding protein 1 isoform X2 n=1 Tax=Abrus precatorius TaxID=3816 RepID=A0A8B8LZN6_ABRPR|nr:plasma membrane-associated cation-binding protein 1 isoform X2 [Abrus precatorius]
MGYWKSKVLPKIKKVFEKNSTKKAAAAEASKSFDESKGLVKDRNEAGLKKNTAAVHKFLEELVKIDFPGSKAVSEACSKFGPASVSGPVFFVFEKVSTIIVTEEKVEAPPTATKAEEETSTVLEREIVVEEEKKEEEKPQVTETTEKKESEPSSEAKIEEQPAEPVASDAKEEKPAEPTSVVEQAEPPKP